MDGISALTTRIAEIRSQMVALEPASASPVAAASTTSSTSLTSSSGATQTSTSESAFAQALAAASATASPSAATASRSAGEVDAKGVPIDLKKYGNGQVPTSALSSVAGTDAVLWAPAARALEALRAAAAKDGVSIGINDSYRSYGSQVAMVKSKGSYSQGGLAAQPGTSMHGWGVATDLHLDAKALSWMKAHADEYGFVDNVARESWHWQYKPAS